MHQSSYEFQKPFSPLKWGDAFTEGNAWHYTWSVFHDPQGLIDLMGGKQVFNQMLDSVFNVPPLFDDSYYGAVIHEIREMQIMNMGNYAHGNQPVQHMIYLYGYSGEPWKTQYWIRQTMDRMYNANPDGYCGDEDNGQTSAWYVFSAMGFYPVCPGSGEYVLGAPRFDEMTLHLENGKNVSIKARNNEDENCYVKALQLNGAPYTKNYVTRTDLMNGASQLRVMITFIIDSLNISGYTYHNSQLSTFNSQLKKLSTLNSQLPTCLFRHFLVILQSVCRNSRLAFPKSGKG